MADGYARASGKVGVAIATSGPGATNMVTGIATAMMDSSPIVCITGQVGSKLIGSDAFQETDITGITLPITKHNYLVTRAEDVAPAVREAFDVARSRAARARCWSTSPRTRSRRSCEFDWDAAAPHLHRGAATMRCRATATSRDAVDADQRRRAAADPGRPRHHAVAAPSARSSRSPSARSIPIAMTLLGIGGVPASHPLNLGMMGMHGEAWVNTAIQEADLLHRARHALRRPRHRQPQDLRARTPRRSTSTSTAPRSTRTSASTSAIVGDLRAALDELLPQRRRRRPRRRGSRTSTTLKGDSAVRDIQNLPDNGHLYAAHVINDLWRAHRRQGRRRHRRRPAPDVGSAVLQARRAALAHHVGRPRHDGLRAAGGDRRQDRAARTPRSGWSSATAASR